MNSLFKYWPCHRLESRCLAIGRWRSPICSRCYGLFWGLVIGPLFWLAEILTTRTIAILFMLPILADALTQEAGWRHSNNALRFLTGVLGGIGVIIYLLSWAQNDFRNMPFLESVCRSPENSSQEPLTLYVYHDIQKRKGQAFLDHSALVPTAEEFAYAGPYDLSRFSQRRNHESTYGNCSRPTHGWSDFCPTFSLQL
ncbi:MAG: DUF2085 domain-containing protein [Myxococcales bacterium]|nr:DUF2085 domain-containing protein [Myxococcales bacterium]